MSWIGITMAIWVLWCLKQNLLNENTIFLYALRIALTYILKVRLASKIALKRHNLRSIHTYDFL